MKKTLFSIALMTASMSVSADYDNGRLTGMSGAGYATGGYTDGVLRNPSLGASFGENDNFAIVVNGGALGAADRELLDDVEEFQDFLDELRSITSVSDLTRDLAERAKDRLSVLEDQRALLDVGGSVVIAIPNDLISLSFIAKSRVEAGVMTFIDEDDYELIENSVNNPFDPEDLNSSLLARGAMVTEVGLALSKSLKAGENSALLLGVTPKQVTVQTFIYSPTLNNFDEDNFDADEFTVETSEFNLDAGLTYVCGKMRYGLAVRDTMEREYETIDGDLLVTKPRTTVAVGYQSDWFTAETAVDMNATPTFTTNTDSQIARAGLQLKPISWLQLRAGMQIDLEDNIEDTYSLGFGISPFNVINVDLAAVKGKGDTLGVAFQAGLRF